MQGSQGKERLKISIEFGDQKGTDDLESLVSLEL